MAEMDDILKAIVTGKAQLETAYDASLEREALTTALKQARKRVARATYNARQAGYEVTTEELIGKAPKYATETIQGLKELLSVYQAVDSKADVIEAYNRLHQAIENQNAEFDGMPLPSSTAVILENFKSGFTDIPRSTLASWLMGKWYYEALFLYGEEDVAEALAKASEAGYDYDDLTYSSGDDGAYQTNEFIHAVMQELHDMDSEKGIAEIDKNRFNSLYNDYTSLWEQELGTHIETGRR